MEITYGSKEYDSEKTCLACLRNELGLHPIYKSNLNRLFVKLTQLEISEHDGYPTSLCISCVVTLRLCSSFREKCLTSYTTLTESLAKKLINTKSTTIDDDLSDNSSENSSESSIDSTSDDSYVNESSSSEDDDIRFTNQYTVEIYPNQEEIIKEKQLNENLKDNTKTSELKENNSSSTGDISLTNANTTEILHVNREENTEEKLKQKTKENYKPLPLILTRLPHMSHDITSCIVIDAEENEAEPMILEETEKVSGSCASSSPISDSLTKIETEFKCTTCGFRYASEDALLGHQKTHAPGEAESKRTGIITKIINGKKVHKCSVCEYTKSDLSMLKIHVRKHTGERPYKCDVCPHASRTSYQLKLHKMMHTGERPFRCNFCPFACNTPHNLKLHVGNMHAGKRSFKCDVCSFASNTSRNLKIHKRRHTGERPYKCDWCSKTFMALGTKRYHVAKQDCVNKAGLTRSSQS